MEAITSAAFADEYWRAPMPNRRAPGITPHTIAFPDDLWHRAQQLAAREGVKVSAVVRAALERYVADE